jgi:hypothetical protein
VPDGYWEEWEPGVGDIAAERAQGGLAQLLRELGIWIQGMTETEVNRVGEAISAGLNDGLPMSEVVARIDAIVHDLDRARLIAETEFIRARERAAMDTYQLNNVPMLQWLAQPGACEQCRQNEAVSPLPLGAPWPQGPPPVHPHERCVVAPYYPPDGVVHAERA